MQVASFAPPTASTGAPGAAALLGIDAATGDAALTADGGSPEAPAGDAGLSFAEALAASLVAPVAVAMAQAPTTVAAEAPVARQQPLLASAPQTFEQALAAAPSAAADTTSTAAPLPAAPAPLQSQAPAAPKTAASPPAYGSPAPGQLGTEEPTLQDSTHAKAAAAPPTAPTSAPAATAAPVVAPPAPAAVVAAVAGAVSQAAAAQPAETAETAAPPPAAAPPPGERASGRADARSARHEARAKAPGNAAESEGNPVIAAKGASRAATAAPTAPADHDASVDGDAAPAKSFETTADPEAGSPSGAAAPQAAALLHASSQAARVDATLPHLAAQIVKKLDAKVTQFDIALHPAGLGKVDVKVQIDRTGAITAALSFDNPQAVAELRGRADELKTALQQAGFDLSDAGLSFDLSGGQQRSTEDRQTMAEAFAGRAFAAAADKAEDLQAAVASAAARLQQRGASGIDIRI